MKLAIFFVLVAVANALTPTQVQQVLDAHNAEREAVGLGPVTYNTSIEQIAQNYVNGCPSDHSGAPNLGENMAWLYSDDLTDSVTMWASEKQYWDCATNRCCQNGKCSWYYCGHYTQIVWASSSQVGCGIKKCGESFTVVCNYYLPGNWNCNPFCDRPFPQQNCPLTNRPQASNAPTSSNAPTAQTTSPSAAPVKTGTPASSLSSGVSQIATVVYLSLLIVLM